MSRTAPMKELKKQLRLLKNSVPRDTDKIKQLSHFIRRKVSHSSIEVNSDQDLPRNLASSFWKTCQTIFDVSKKVSPCFSCLAAYDYFTNLLANLLIIMFLPSLRLHGFQPCLMPLFHSLRTHLPTRKLTKQFKKLQTVHPHVNVIKYQLLFSKSVPFLEPTSPSYWLNAGQTLIFPTYGVVD